jgi:alkylhydroperoxidase/carboxymuconolactone decarboxylase family protein YurZ
MVSKQNGGTPWYILNSPEIGGAFQKVEDLLQNNGVLEEKTETLIRLALSAVFRDTTATENNVQRAIAHGATREEITEVFLITTTQYGKAHLTWAENIHQQYLLGKE